MALPESPARSGWEMLGHIPGSQRNVAARMCVCGKIKIHGTASLRSGKSQSCGCLRRSNFKHGYATKGAVRAEWQAWNHMIQRCTNPNDRHYKDYGARGIRVCPEWSVSFEQFLRDMGDRPSRDYSLDRIDGNADYGPDNCRWANHKTQAQNRRSVIWIECYGQRMCVADWVRTTGINRSTILARFHKGMPAEQVLSPVRTAVNH